jgi:hypothetical protein
MEQYRRKAVWCFISTHFLPRETMSLMDPQFAWTARVYINAIYWRSSMDIVFSPMGAQYLIHMFPQVVRYASSKSISSSPILV